MLRDILNNNNNSALREDRQSHSITALSLGRTIKSHCSATDKQDFHFLSGFIDSPYLGVLAFTLPQGLS